MAALQGEIDFEADESGTVATITASVDETECAASVTVNVDPDVPDGATLGPNPSDSLSAALTLIGLLTLVLSRAAFGKALARR